ncbi:phosphoenolpyruvate--protein phosphotransferase [Actinoplanes sp. NPDC051859]|uniref:phosphoenolpyruvate--protein phosphotransferase n=1 Tax=Actinoplanes sp. NPDC051859 TaxID=3363909 RepID=UPI0037B6661C
MVGLVVVSHSRVLAQAAVALAAEMVPAGAVPIEVAAGLDETTFGTDAVAVADAITAADQGEGVVVLMDVGSAVLSAELALELLADDEHRERVVLCPAPLVEGLVAAVVAAAGGAGRNEVAGEAADALAGKLSQLGLSPASPPIDEPAPTTPTPATSARAGSPALAPAPAGAALENGIPVAPETTAAAEVGAEASNWAEATVTVTGRHGLHARPAARLVTAVRGLDARVEIRNRSTESDWAPANSLSRVTTLSILEGQQLEVRASGPQAHAAVAQVVALATHDSDGVRKLPTSATPGVGIGPARHLGADDIALPERAYLGADEEWRQLEAARATVRSELRRLRTATAHAVDESQAAIFDAHVLLLDDEDLLSAVRQHIADGMDGPHAWAAASHQLAEQFDALDDAYLKARSADVRAVARQTLRALLGGVAGSAEVEAGVLIAADLTPAEAAELDPARVAGVLLAFGSATSHSVILARGRGIPAIAGAGPAVLDIPAGTTVALDGSTGEMVIDPDESVLASFRRRLNDQSIRQERANAQAHQPAVTRDGTRIFVGANVGSVADARAAVAHGAELVGLLRTEFLFLGRDTAPDIEEQEAVYREIAGALDGRRLTVRTIDIGGDKPLSYLPGVAEANPYLGVRGIRHSLAHPALLADQLLAIARVARDAPVSVMFPMISTVGELLTARRMLDDAVARTGTGTPGGLRVGLMMEVPAAALKAAAFAPYADFFSVGTNDLTQYAMAAERGNPALAGLSDGLDPGVLRLIDAVCRGAGDRVSVSVCGELAGDDAAVGLLIGLGVRELSVAPGAVPAVKECVRAVELTEAGQLAERALHLADAAAVRALHPTVRRDYSKARTGNL